MEKRQHYLGLGLLMAMLASCNGPKEQKETWPPSTLVELKQSEGILELHNATADTLSFSGKVFNYLPYHEMGFDLSLAPNSSEQLSFSLSYPDFVPLGPNGLRCLIAPGQRVKAIIHEFAEDKAKLSFEGGLYRENEYYLAYFNHFKGKDKEVSPFYHVEVKDNDFTGYSKIADSLAQESFAFLKAYEGTLPNWFKKHEYWRLTYNTAFRKYNVPLSAKRSMEKDAYYSFDKDIPMIQPAFLMGSEYLWYAMFRVSRLANQYREGREQAVFQVIDSLYTKHPLGDALRIRHLSDIRRQGIESYEKWVAYAHFADSSLLAHTDKHIKKYFSKPTVGEKAPDIDLEDDRGNTIKLSSIHGKKAVIINFWATWCKGCIEEFPYEEQWHKQYESEGLSIINICVMSNKSNWQQMINKEKSSMPSYFVEPSQWETLNGAYELSSLPRSILLDSSLQVKNNYYKRASKYTKEEIEGLLQ